MSPTAYSLRQPVTARKPSRWDIHACYAMRLPDQPVDLPAGTWLLALPEPEGSQSHPLHYRLADGRVVCLDAPLTAGQADPQALTALATFTDFHTITAAALNSNPIIPPARRPSPGDVDCP